MKKDEKNTCKQPPIDIETNHKQRGRPPKQKKIQKEIKAMITRPAYNEVEVIKVSLGIVTTEYVPTHIEEGFFGDQTQVNAHYKAQLRSEDGKLLALGEGVLRNEAIVAAMTEAVTREVLHMRSI